MFKKIWENKKKINKYKNAKGNCKLKRNIKGYKMIIEIIETENQKRKTRVTGHEYEKETGERNIIKVV